MTEFASLYALFEAIPDEQAAIDHFRSIRWKNGAFCPYCGGLRIYDLKGNRKHKCGDCRLSFSVKVGTIFEDTKIPMRKWLAAIWLITSHKKGIASTQLARDIGVTQKTAWFMLHRLRHAARTRSFNRPLNGEVEVDETFLGGRSKNRSLSARKADKDAGIKRSGIEGKAIVMGLLERGGDLRAGVVGGTIRCRTTCARSSALMGSPLLASSNGATFRAMPKTYDDKMSLDMPFDEALERYIGTDPEEYAAAVAASKKAKPEAERKRPAPKPDQTNVTDLRSKRKPGRTR